MHGLRSPSRWTQSVQRGGDVSLELVGDGSWLLRVLLPLMQSVMAWMAEAMFKSFAKALDAATQYDSRITDVLSTKGSL